MKEKINPTEIVNGLEQWIKKISKNKKIKGLTQIKEYCTKNIDTNSDLSKQLPRLLAELTIAIQYKLAEVPRALKLALNGALYSVGTVVVLHGKNSSEYMILSEQERTFYETIDPIVSSTPFNNEHESKQASKSTLSCVLL